MMDQRRVRWFRAADGSLYKKMWPPLKVALDPGFEREQRKQPREYQGDSFDKFCALQRNRFSGRLERAVTRVQNARDDHETFESRR